jgi:signal transduction histidine kinase
MTGAGCADGLQSREGSRKICRVQLGEAFLKQSKTLVWVEVLLWISAVSVLDYYSPQQFSTFIFYALPVFALSWHSGFRSGMTFAVCGVVVHFLANVHWGAHHSAQFYVWSMVNRLTSRTFVAMCGASLRRYREAVCARIETINRTRTLEREIVRASEREQMRIGQDLHDGICQNLAAIDCAAECLRANLEAEGILQAKTAIVLQKLVKETMQDARNLARGIFPVQMGGDGFSAALNDLVATTNQLRQASITFEANDHILVSDPATAMHLYRIAQEALSNAVRHAKALHITVRLAYHGESLAITIADDGCGYSREATNSDGMGLRTMQYRAQLIGARVTINSVPSRGTSVSCTLPMPPHLADWEPSEAPAASGAMTPARILGPKDSALRITA